VTRTRPGATILVICAIVLAQQTARRALVAAVPDELRPPATLAETGLYEADRPLVVAAQNRSYSPQYPLWSDGAAKARWVYLPPDTVIDDVDVNAWDFPVGTRFWKEFSFNGRRVETRMLWKGAPDRWVFASYAWNSAGTEATLAPEEGIPSVAQAGEDRRHSIPSVADCRACHDTTRTEILGFNALQLSPDRDPGAIHGEPLAPGMVTLTTLIEDGTLRRSELLANPPRIRAESARTRAVLGYLATNCGNCHNRDTDIAQLGPSLKHGDVAAAGEAAAQHMVARRTTWQAPGLEEGASVLIDPRAPDMSALLLRMRSRRPSSQMPPVGTVLPDREALDTIARWIETDLVLQP
jgi:cytochrome c553